jgi:hypothetical protein
MLKLIALVCAWMLLGAGVMSGQPNQASTGKQKPAAQSQPSVVSTNGNDQQHPSGQDQPKTGNNPPSSDTAVQLSHWWSDSNWWLVIVAVFTGGVIGWQAWETRKAAKATADAANAAYGSLTFMEAQLELTREKERARLELNVQHTDLDVEVAGEDLAHLIATISVRNIGASKAFIGRTSGTLITRLRNEVLESTEDYSPLDFPEKVIAPDQSPVPIKVYLFPTTTARTFAECLEEGTFCLALLWVRRIRNSWILATQGIRI